MLNYYLDQEFIEGVKKPISWLPTIGSFNRPQFFIQLISIGIVRADGKSYYAISNEFNESLASQWVKDNVLSKLPQRFSSEPVETADGVQFLDYEHPDYKSLDAIRKEIKEFLGLNASGTAAPQSQFWGYFADYDWVLFCSTVFGKMINLPAGIQMYCRDLKQYMDETVELIMEDESAKGIQRPSKRNFKEELGWLKSSAYYPEQTDEHHALEDARWNLKLHHFLKLVRIATLDQFGKK